MSGGGGGHTILGTKTVTENGTYVALDDEFDGYSTVTVALPLNSKSITANGTYLASSDELEGYTDVTVNVSPNVGTKTITENGTYLASSDNKDGYSEVTAEEIQIIKNRNAGQPAEPLYDRSHNRFVRFCRVTGRIL